MTEIMQTKSVVGSGQTRTSAPEPGGGTRAATHSTLELPALIPVPMAAALLGLSRASAYRYAAAGELPTKRFGRRIYVITNRIRGLLEDPMPEEAA